MNRRKSKKSKTQQETTLEKRIDARARAQRTNRPLVTNARLGVRHTRTETTDETATFKPKQNWGPLRVVWPRCGPHGGLVLQGRSRHFANFGRHGPEFRKAKSFS